MTSALFLIRVTRCPSVAYIPLLQILRAGRLDGIGHVVLFF
jgi:hypothetical protein